MLATGLIGQSHNACTLHFGSGDPAVTPDRTNMLDLTLFGMSCNSLLSFIEMFRCQLHSTACRGGCPGAGP